MIKKLTAGKTYSISVVAWSTAGPSPAATTTYTVPKPATNFIFVFDTTAESIVKIPTAGGPATTVTGGLTDAIEFAVDKAGNTFIADPAAKSVFKVAADQPRRTRIRSGLADLRDIQVDASGRAYVLSGSTVIRLAASGSPERVIGTSPAGFTADAMFVDGGGTVSILSKQDFDENLLTIPASGTPTSRSIGAMYEGSSYLGMVGDQAGTIYLNVASGGGSGYVGWNKIAAGSSEQVNATTKLAEYAATVGPTNEFYLFQTVAWCAGVSEYLGTCTADRTVPEILKTAPGGTATSVPIQGLTLGTIAGNDAGVSVDRAGNIYVAQSSGPSAGLLRYAPSGGAPVVLAAGTFTAPDLND